MLQQISDEIRTIRPSIAESTIKQHARSIYKIYTTLWPNHTMFHANDIIACPSNILISAFPKNSSQDTKKSYAASLGIFTSRPELSKIVTDANELYRNRINQHIPTESEINNKLTMDDMQEIDRVLKQEYETNTYEGLKKYLLWNLMNGKYIPPRRLLDWTHMKIHHVNESIDNYIDHTTQEFVFNRYKTAHIYGQDRIGIPPPLYNLLCQYIAQTVYDYMFSTQKGSQLSTSNFSLMINDLSGNKHGHSVNQYRKCYLQTNFGNIIDLQHTMRMMGSSKNNINSYIKHL
jgi:hypothetical protein